MSAWGLKKAGRAQHHGPPARHRPHQQLVKHSVDIVHRFARELRPTVLDDLGFDSRPSYVYEELSGGDGYPGQFIGVCGD